MSELRIVSFLPSATEMVCTLGLADHLVGVTHECDYPPEVRRKPVVVRNSLPLQTMTLEEIDAAVSQRIRSGASLYEVDEELLRELAPTLLLTQNLCQVCAPSGNEVTRLLRTLQPPPQVLWLTPHSLRDIEDNLREVGKATGRLAQANALIADGRRKLDEVEAVTSRATTRPRVFCVEWVDPLYGSGHWVPEMVSLAGGIDSLSRPGQDSVRVSREQICKWAPEVLIVNPCGFSLTEATRQATTLLTQPRWSELSAVREGRVYAVDANAYFARPGPRLIDGVRLLAELIHPELFPQKLMSHAFARVTNAEAAMSPSNRNPGIP